MKQAFSLTAIVMLALLFLAGCRQPFRNVRLGMSKTEVRQILGAPTKDDPYNKGKAVERWVYQIDEGNQDVVYFSKEGKVIRISQNRWGSLLQDVGHTSEPTSK